MHPKVRTDRGVQNTYHGMVREQTNNQAEEEKMKSLRWRYSTVLGMLVLVGFLFCFSTTRGHAYPTPELQNVKFFSMHQGNTLIGTVAVARVIGPSPDDVVSFDISGNGVNMAMNPWKSLKQSGLYYLGLDPAVVPDGNYVFTVKDSQGRSVSITKNFSYDGTIPQVDPNTMVPANGAYVGTTTPTLSFSPVAGDDLYDIQIRDMGDTAIWYDTDTSTATSYTIPAGILQPYTAYIWRARVWDKDEQNLHVTQPFYFYTGTKAAPELNVHATLSFPAGEDDLAFFPYGRDNGIAPWDIAKFQCTGPDSTVYDLTTQRYQFNYPLYISGWKLFDPPTSTPPDGTYTFEIEDNLGRTATKSNTYTYDPIPDFIADTRSPADNTYVDGETPTFSWSRVEGDPGDGSYLYSIRITDYSTKMRWVDSPRSSDTTFTPSGTFGLPEGSSYKWRVNVIDAKGNNYRASDYLTITFNEDVVPVPDIKANGSDGPVTVSSSDTVSINISLDPRDKAGRNADWWVGVVTPFDPPLDYFTYVFPTGWQSGINLCVQTPLLNLPSFEVFNMTLPVGTYTFFFALDNPDGIPAGPWWGLDSVEVTVQ